MEFTSERGEQRYAALVRAAAETVVALDFDGTLSPIVDDPEQAVIHPDAAEVLVAVAEQVSAVAVVTGRPARQVLDLGRLESLADALDDVGKDLYVFGQYGAETWSTTERRIRSPRPPAGLSAFLRDLPGVLRQADAADAYVEQKGLAIAVHTRRLPDADAALERLSPKVRDLADRHDLVIEPGHHVVEVRSGEMDKGKVARRLVDALTLRGFLFAGDDLGDVEAFDTLEDLDREGLAVLRVAASSREELGHRADLLVEGPDGVLDLLRQFAADAGSLRA